jgi:diguanylate cyclase (GGDEF)-like protein
MLLNGIQFLHIAQLPVAQAGQLLLVTAISFIVITLITSTYRFHRMIQLSETALKTVEDCNDFFFIQVTRYLSKINRSSSGFCVFIIQFVTDNPDKRAVQEKLLAALRLIIRHDTDKACLFRDDCVTAIIDTEETNTAEMAQRITTDIQTFTASIQDIKSFRIGVSSFPMHGLSTQTIIDAAAGALETVKFDSYPPLGIAPRPVSDEQDQNLPSVVGELSRQDKDNTLDALTGVLNPSVVGSYMRKYLAEIRHRKQPAVLLCVGINRIDQIIKLHGEQAADDVIAGVSKVLQRLTRDGDLIGRYHRDDFLVLAPCSLQQGEMIAVRLREAVQKEVFASGIKKIKATVSIGITAHPKHGRNLRDLFRGSYRALEVIRDWHTTACLVYDPAQHAKKH